MILLFTLINIYIYEIQHTSVSRMSSPTCLLVKKSAVSIISCLYWAPFVVSSTCLYLHVDQKSVKWKVYVDGSYFLEVTVWLLRLVTCKRLPNHVFWKQKILKLWKLFKKPFELTWPLRNSPQINEWYWSIVIIFCFQKKLWLNNLLPSAPVWEVTL